MNSLSQELNALLAQPDPHLDEVMVMVAQLSSKPPTLGEVAGELDRLAHQLGSQPPAPASLSPERLLTFIHGTVGFHGDANDYHKPSNSFIQQALRRRKGIPLTLTAIDVEVGRRLDLELSVVGMPGHVLLGNGARPNRWFDPFAGGTELNVDGCIELFTRFRPASQFDRSMLEPISALTFCRRMLANLRMAYLRFGDMNQLINILELAANLDQAPIEIRSELAQFLAAAGRSEQAANEYDHLAELEPNKSDAYRLSARRLRTHRN